MASWRRASGCGGVRLSDPDDPDVVVGSVEAGQQIGIPEDEIPVAWTARSEGHEETSGTVPLDSIDAADLSATIENITLTPQSGQSASPP